MTRDDLRREIEDAVCARRRLLVANHNSHSVFLCHHDPEMRRYFELADLVHVDGMPLILAARLVGAPLGREHRTTYVDFIHPLLDLAAARGWRVFHLGGRPEVNVSARRVLLEHHPALDLSMHHGYFDATPGSSESRAVLEEIRAAAPQLLFVGMGMPRQERWILHHRDELPATVILPCGACFDYLAGAIPTPPRWLARLGFEWLARLVAEPRRLVGRYLVEPWFLLWLLLLDQAKRLGGALRS